MHWVEAFLNYASALFAFAAAGLWWKAASFEAPAAFVSKVRGSQYGADGEIHVQVDIADVEAFDKARRRPGNWNKYAAASTGISAALMATALVVGSLSAHG